MTLTAFLAQLLGLYIALMGVIMIVKRRTMMGLMAAFVDHRPFTYVLASLRVLIGLAIVLAHNRWTGVLSAVVTLIGWITLLRGIVLMLLPYETERKALTYFQRSGPYYAAATIAIVLGLWLAYAGFTA